MKRVLVAAGTLFVVATLLHPSQETAVTILETEPRLVASHAIYIISYVLMLLGLPRLHADVLVGLGRGAQVGFLVTFVGVSLRAISSQFGFIAPVLAAEAPETLDTIIYYAPVVTFNGVAAVSFMAGFVLLGIVVARSVSRWGGVAMALGAPIYLLGFGVSQLGSPALWFVAILGALLLGSGVALTGLARSEVRITKSQRI